MSILFSLLTNPVTISVLVLCVLCLTGLNVLLSMLIACIIGGVAGNANAIGYASLSAVDDTVSAVKVGGVECSEATVKDGTYKVQRPFVLVTKEGTELSDTAQKFFDYATSADAAEVISAAGAVSAN